MVAIGALAVLAGPPSVAHGQVPGSTSEVDPAFQPPGTTVAIGTDPATTEPSTADPGTTEAPGSTPLDTDAEVTVVDTADPAPTAPDTKEIDDENRKFAIIVAGLVAVAVALSLLTAYYWRVTKPGAYDEFDDVDDEDDEYGFDDEDDDRGPSGDVDELDDDELFVSSGPRSRQAIAGADHADVDAGWEPLATGEQERVSGQVRRATSRPSPRDRARAFGAAGGADTDR